MTSHDPDFTTNDLFWSHARNLTNNDLFYLYPSKKNNNIFLIANKMGMLHIKLKLKT